ncbi:heme NO-binding domain-containing protein [Gammaproteobacteria bacterium]|nr:heme NO-binding domain-containing protein [Gammaproteobacteria bacterium]
MYGIIHKAIRDMVKTVHGEQAWLSVLNESGAADGDFLSLRSYNDEIAYNLVGACSKILGEVGNKGIWLSRGEVEVLIVAANA